MIIGYRFYRVTLRSLSFGFIFAFALVLALACTGCTTTFSSGEGKPGDPVPGMRYHAVVTNVVDGDTLDVQFPGGTTERVRILGVDTPETTVGANSGGEYGNIDDTVLLAEWGGYAGCYTRAFLDGREIVLEVDRSAGTRDRYGRVLAYVTSPDGSDFGALLLREGLARAYTAENFSRKDEYIRLEQAARETGTGLWAGLPPAAPCDMQVSKPALSPEQLQNSHPAPAPDLIPDPPAGPAGPCIQEVVYDPPGDDREDPNGEYIIISNAGPETVDLGGWMIREGGGVAFTFPRIPILPGDTITLHPGKGTGNSTSVYWNHTSPLLNNDRDTVTLLDPSGMVVSTFTWGK